VVPQRHRVGAGGQQALREPWRDAEAVRDVLAVDDARVDLEALAERREQPFDRVAAGTSDDVPDEQQAHG